MGLPRWDPRATYLLPILGMSKRQESLKLLGLGMPFEERV